MPRKSFFYLFLFISLLLSSCEFQCSVGETGSAKENKKYKPVEKDGTLLYNGIRLVTRGVQVDKAYLVTNDEAGDRIDDDNFIDFKRGVKMLLLVKDGWKEEEGRMRLGTSMKVVTENGQVLIDEEDMMKKYDEEGISPIDSKVLGLSVYKLDWVPQQPISMTVHFRVWDKQGEAFIDGDYIFHTK